jgi:hypothetical protein
LLVALLAVRVRWPPSDEISTSNAGGAMRLPQDQCSTGPAADGVLLTGETYAGSGTWTTAVRFEDEFDSATADRSGARHRAASVARGAFLR